MCQIAVYQKKGPIKAIFDNSQGIFFLNFADMLASTTNKIQGLELLP